MLGQEKDHEDWLLVQKNNSTSILKKVPDGTDKKKERKKNG